MKRNSLWHRGLSCTSFWDMAWRIDEQVVRGEIDNRLRGRVTGRIWFAGRDRPVELDLEGNAWRDVAGHLLRFTNPRPEPGDLEKLARLQRGVAGDISASRRVKIPECSVEEIREYHQRGEAFPWHWSNSLYLEWFSERNGRVVIETADFEIEIDPEAAWEMTEEEEADQKIANAQALTGFMEMAGRMVAADDDDDSDDDDDDAPQSQAEAEADAEAARMDLLLDRVTARLEREGRDDKTDFDRIYLEERERLRRERGEPEEEKLTPEQEAERAVWIDEMNAAAEDAAADLEAEKWKGEDPFERHRHPLVERCSDLGVKLHRDVEAAGWLPENPQREHPLMEIVDGAMIAGAKLSGALHSHDEEWPPDALFAGDTLVRLKKARACLRDVIRGLDSADEENLATPEWRATTRREISEILGEVQELIRDVRDILADEDVES